MLDFWRVSNIGRDKYEVRIISSELLREKLSLFSENARSIRNVGIPKNPKANTLVGIFSIAHGVSRPVEISGVYFDAFFRRNRIV